MRHPRFTASTFLIAAALAIPVYGDGIDDFYEKAMAELNAFNDKNQSEFDAFCKKIDKQMLEFMDNPWKSIKKEKPIPKPVEPKPVVIEYDEDTDTIDHNDAPPVPIKRTVTPPKPRPQPAPPKPLPPPPKIDEAPDVRITFYGTPVTVKGFKAPNLSCLATASESTAKSGFEQLTKVQSTQLLASLLKWRSDLSLPDWGYVKLVQAVSEKYYGKDTNASRLLHSFLLQRSGYDIRLGLSGNQLVVLAAVEGGIYGIGYFPDCGKNYYSLYPTDSQMHICDFKYPGEQQISLRFNDVPDFSFSPGAEHTITVKNHPDITLKQQTNQNLIDFYNDYPTGWLGNDIYTRWAIYANVPASAQMKQNIYPRLKQALQGKNQYEAVGLLLKVAQSFPYEYDDNMWGDDRAFFPDESWHYLKSDCEDHAIHFSRLVRDLIGLNVCLVYYPGHLAAAVEFTDSKVTGEHIMHNGRKYIFCDPTYFYAGIGIQAPNYVNAEKILIETKKQ